MLLDDFNEIASNPDLGKNYSEITEDLFGFKAGRYIIFYRTIKESEIEIIGILHEEMDLNNRVKEKQTHITFIIYKILLIQNTLLPELKSIYNIPINLFS